MEKKILERIYKWEYFPFLCMFIIYFLLHCILFSWIADDIINFSDSAVRNDTIFDGIKRIFEPSTWSSRVLVDGVLGNLLCRMVDNYSVLSWCIIDSLLWVIVGISFSKIMYNLFGVKDRSIKWIIIGVILNYPFMELNSAGWLATTCTYFWTFSIGAWFLSEYVESLFVNKSWWKDIVYCIALLFATNIEGGAIFFTVFFIGVFVSEFITKTVRYRTICYTFLCFVSICWHLFSVGNQYRASAEVVTWFKNYDMLNFVDKLELVVNRCTYNYILNYNVIFVMFSIFLFLAVKGRCMDGFYRTIGMIPLLITVLFGIVSRLGLYDGLNIGGTLSKEGAITVGNYNSFSSYISTILGIVVYLCICISFYVVLNQYSHLIIAICIFAGGMGSWMVMMFSPTVWASVSRPFTTLNFVFLGLTIWLVFIVLKTKAINEKKVYGIVCFFAICNIFNHIL